MPALKCCKCCRVFDTIADTLNSPLETLPVRVSSASHHACSLSNPLSRLVFHLGLVGATLERRRRAARRLAVKTFSVGKVSGRSPDRRLWSPSISATRRYPAVSAGLVICSAIIAVFHLCVASRLDSLLASNRRAYAANHARVTGQKAPFGVKIRRDDGGRENAGAAGAAQGGTPMFETVQEPPSRSRRCRLRALDPDPQPDRRGGRIRRAGRHRAVSQPTPVVGGHS